MTELVYNINHPTKCRIALNKLKALIPNQLDTMVERELVKQIVEKIITLPQKITKTSGGGGGGDGDGNFEKDKLAINM